VVGGFDRPTSCTLRTWTCAGGSRGRWAVAYEPAAQVVHVQGVSATATLTHVARPSRVHVAFRPARHTAGGAGCCPGPARLAVRLVSRWRVAPWLATVTGPARAGARRKVTW